MKLNRTPNPLDRNARNGENDNWERIEGSIKRIDDTVSDLVLESGGDSNLEVVQARGGKPVLNDRLNDIEEEITDNMSEVSSQLAETKQQIINETNQKLSLKRDKSVLIGLGDVGQDIIDGLNGGNNFSLLGTPRNESVTPIKTTFFNISSNLFNKNEIIEGYGIDGSTGEPVVNATLNLSGFMPVKPSTHYIRSQSNRTARWAFYREDGSFITSTLDSPIIQTPNEAVLMRISLVVEFDLDVFIINEGTVLLPYEDFYEYFDMDYVRDKSIGTEKYKDKSITPNKLTIIKKSPNLLNKETAIKGKGIDANTGDIVDNNTLYLFVGIEIKELTNYIRSEGAMRVAFYKKDGTFISSTTREDFVSPKDSVIANVVVHENAFNNTGVKLALNEGTTLTGEDFYEVIDEQYLPKTENDNNKLKKEFNFVPEVPFYEYIANELPPADGTEDFDHETTKSVDVYNKYRELENNHSDYLKMTLQGDDQSDALPVYKIELTPNTDIGDLDIKNLPTIFISCGIHGDGSGGQGDGTGGDPPTHVFSMYYFIKELCENWQSSKALEYIRHNVNLVIIPIANPWGFDNKSRLNSRGVDINRNFDSNWRSGSTHGSSAFSEKETQYIRNAFNEAKNVFMSFDYHMIGGLDFIYDDKLLRYFLYEEDKDSQQIAGQTMRELSRKWRGKHGLSDSIERYGSAEYYTTGGTAMRWFYFEGGVTSLTIEGFLATQGHQEKSGSVAMTLNVEHLGNYIMNGIRYFYNKQ